MVAPALVRPPMREAVVAESVRSVFGLATSDMDDDEALDRVLNPARNRYRLDILNVSYHSPLMRALHHATYVFEKRLSHTADSQDQRHRMVPASRPLMTFADTAAARLHYAAAHRRQPARARPCTTRRCRRRGTRRTSCSPWTCRSSTRSTAAQRQDAAVRRVGIAAGAAPQVDAAHAASTRRKRSISRRWTRSSRCERCIRASAATSVRPASSATA